MVLEVLPKSSSVCVASHIAVRALLDNTHNLHADPTFGERDELLAVCTQETLGPSNLSLKSIDYCFLSSQNLEERELMWRSQI